MGVQWIIRVRALLIISIFFSSLNLFGQSNCDDLVLMDQGNQVFKNKVCAPVDFDWLVFCKKINTKTVKFVYDWGDGVEETVTPNYNAGTNQYEFTASHTYPHAAATVEKCNYEAKVYIEIDGERCTDNPQEQSVIVWDVDEENGGEMRVDPVLYRVCEGNDALISFADNSQWNCVPPDIAQNLNQANRWTQWIYGTTGSTIADVVVNGGVQAYPYVDPANIVEHYPTPALSPNSQSLDVYVPNTATVGQMFKVKLRNWNQCNAYDNDVVVDPVSPVNGNLMDGDNAPIETEATILIVEKVDPNFKTRLNDASGPEQNVFCIGDQIYFEDITAAITDADFQYTWEMYDNQSGTGTPISTSNSQNPTFSYSTSGKKLIRLSITDGASVGNCGGFIEKKITIFPTPEAQLASTDLSDNPIVPEFCQDNALSNSFDVKLNDVTAGYDASSTWEWNFYEKNNTSVIESTQSGTGPTGASFTRTYTDPGIYMVELISSNVGVSCNTRDTLYIKVFSDPEADFTSNEVCESDSTLFSSLATLPTVVDGDSINSYAWDFNYDGITFTPDTVCNSPDPFNYKLDTAGTYQVALQVSTAKGGCSNLIVKDVVVKPIPYTSFTSDPAEGCPDLEVNFSVDTLLSNQPIGITKYIWHITDHYTGTVNSYEVDPPQDSFAAPPFTYDRSDNKVHTYGIQLEAISTNGCDQISEPDTIKVFPDPESGFNITNLTAADKNCSPREYEFRANKATRDLSPDTYQWTIVDEESNVVVDTIVTSGHNFSYILYNEDFLVKSFTVTMQPQKVGMCIKPSDMAVNVNPNPSSTFTISEIYADCSIVTYYVEAEQKSIIYNWDVSATTVNSPDLTADRMELTFNRINGTSQNIDIELITTNVVGCKSTPTIESVNISEKENINASFTIDPVKQKIPNSTVNIINNTNPGSWDYIWDFGDSTTSTAVDPGSHIYDSYGNYNIKLTVTGNDCVESDSITAIIEPTVPVVDFTYTQIDGCLPVIVSFINQSQYSNPDSYLWDFGDGTTSTEENPTHTYRENGIYTVTLQASNILGVLIKTEMDIVVELENGAQADFNIQKATKYLPDEPVYLSNYSQNASSYWWDFGDGGTSNQVEPNHIYRNSGEYEITLIAYNPNGCTDTISNPITILPIEPMVDFEFTPTSGCRPLTVQFTNLSRYAEPGTYYWSFGQGQGVSSDENPTYTYYEPGIYTVTLRASNSAGVTIEERKEFSIEVYDNPLAGFTVRPEEVFLPQPIFLANLSRGGMAYQWDFGDGNGSTEFEPQHIYQNAGSYDITLIVENEYGCSDTLVQENAVYVEEGGTINIPNAFTPSLDGPGASEIVNGNSYNDVFLPVFEGVTEFHMLIFNRWGELLFESFDKSKGWDGYFKGRLTAKDVYVYKLELKFSDGRRETIAGDVTLLR